MVKWKKVGKDIVCQCKELGMQELLSLKKQTKNECSMSSQERLKGFPIASVHQFSEM